MSRRLALVGAFLLAAAASGEQPCPCPPAPAGPPPLWSGKGEFSYLATSGNTDTSSLGGAIEVNYKPLPWAIGLNAAYLRAATDGVLTAESLAAGLRAMRDLTPRLDVFAAGLYYRNTFAGIDSRFGGEAGTGYKLLAEKNLRLRAEAGFGYTREDPVDTDDVELPSFGYAALRAGLQFGWKFSKSAELTEEFYWTDNLSDTNDWYLRSTTAIAADLTSIFALKASYTYLYDNLPVPGFEKRDTITSLALVAKF